jgi:MHS family proline/betaine transporter-like MFS transporter
MVYLMNTAGFRSILAGSVGNILEWYDFSLYAFLAPIFAKLFFPHANHATALILVFGVFAAGFVVRPLGGIVFGHIGDRYGRAVALQLTVLCMSISTMLTGFLPTFDNLEKTAVGFLLLMRLLQGLCMGGEFAGAIVYLGEIAPPGKRGFIASFANTGSNIGILMATGMTAFFMSHLTAGQMSQWGWRVLYITGGALGFIFLMFRRNMAETPVFKKCQKNERSLQLPIKQIIHYSKWPVLKVMLFVCMGSSLFYVAYVYLPTYLHDYAGMSMPQTLYLMTAYNTLSLLLLPLFGFISDQYGRRNCLLLIAMLTVLFSGVSFYLMLKQSFFLVIMGSFLITSFSTMEQAVMPATLVVNFPEENRYTGLALGYNLAYALFGGAAPLLLSCLIVDTGSLFSPAYYLMVMATVTGIAIFFAAEKIRS